MMHAWLSWYHSSPSLPSSPGWGFLFRAGWVYPPAGVLGLPAIMPYVILLPAGVLGFPAIMPYGILLPAGVLGFPAIMPYVILLPAGVLGFPAIMSYDPASGGHATRDPFPHNHLMLDTTSVSCAQRGLLQHVAFHREKARYPAENHDVGDERADDLRGIRFLPKCREAATQRVKKVDAAIRQHRYRQVRDGCADEIFGDVTPYAVIGGDTNNLQYPAGNALNEEIG